MQDMIPVRTTHNSQRRRVRNERDIDGFPTRGTTWNGHKRRSPNLLCPSRIHQQQPADSSSQLAGMSDTIPDPTRPLSDYSTYLIVVVLVTSTYLIVRRVLVKRRTRSTAASAERHSFFGTTQSGGIRLPPEDDLGSAYTLPPVSSSSNKLNQEQEQPSLVRTYRDQDEDDSENNDNQGVHDDDDDDDDDEPLPRSKQTPRSSGSSRAFDCARAVQTRDHSI